MPTSELLTDRLRLTPLIEADANPMLDVLSDPRLYHYTGEEPPTIESLRERYQRQVRGAPVGSSEEWFNWIVRWRQGQAPLGFVQATVAEGRADVAWLIGIPWQGQGLAREAAQAMLDRLRTCEVTTISAHIHPGHIASQRVAAAIGLMRTGVLDSDGEEEWASP